MDMAQDWDLQAVVRGFTTGSSTTNAAASSCSVAAAAAGFTNASASNALAPAGLNTFFDHPEVEGTFFDMADLFVNPALAATTELHDMFMSFDDAAPLPPEPVSPVYAPITPLSSIGGPKDLAPTTDEKEPQSLPQQPQMVQSLQQPPPPQSVQQPPLMPQSVQKQPLLVQSVQKQPLMPQSVLQRPEIVSALPCQPRLVQSLHQQPHLLQSMQQPPQMVQSLYQQPLVPQSKLQQPQMLQSLTGQPQLPLSLQQPPLLIQSLQLQPQLQQQVFEPGQSSKATAPPNRIKKRKNVTKVVVEMPEEATATDSWSWRKYGQKPIKGSPYPRGYYRCSTSKSCMARKQVERNRANSKTFIVTYAAEHNHPQPNFRSSLAGSTRNRQSISRSTVSGEVKKRRRSPPVSPSASLSSAPANLEMENSRVIGDEEGEVNGYMAITDDFFSGLDDYEMMGENDLQNIQFPWLSDTSINTTTTTAAAAAAASAGDSI